MPRRKSITVYYGFIAVLSRLSRFGHSYQTIAFLVLRLGDPYFVEAMLIVFVSFASSSKTHQFDHDFSMSLSLFQAPARPFGGSKVFCVPPVGHVPPPPSMGDSGYRSTAGELGRFLGGGDLGGDLGGVPGGVLRGDPG